MQWAMTLADAFAAGDYGSYVRLSLRAEEIAREGDDPAETQETAP